MRIKTFCQFFFRENKRLVCFLMMLFLSISFLLMVRPILVGYLFQHSYQMKHIANYITLLVSLNVFIILLSLMRGILYTRFEINMLEYLQTLVMKKLLQLPLYFFDRYAIGELTQRVLWINALSQFFNANQMGVFLSFLSLLFSFSLMFYFNWQLTVLVFILVSLFTVFAIISSMRLVPALMTHAKDMGHAYGFLFQIINGISRINLFAKQSNIESHWLTLYVLSRKRLQKTYREGALSYAFFHSLPLLLLMIIFAFNEMHLYPFSSHDFIVFFCGLSLLIASIVTFYINAGGLMDALIAYKRIQPILTEPSEEVEGVDASMHKIRDIRMQGLQFTYPNTILPILKHVDFHVLSGEHVGLVGLSGSGKSTLIKLLLGFYVPQQGQIEINGKSLKEIDLLKFRSSIGVVLQDGQLMNGSILDNLIGHTHATEEEAQQILSILGLDSFIASLPMGIHTQVAQHMPLLSGGQKQRLLIARALVGRPQLLILDEATNSLDNHSQAMITQCINQLGIMRITIAHRLSTIREADNIFVLHEGRIAQVGVFEELVEQEGLFQQLAAFNTSNK